MRDANEIRKDIERKREAISYATTDALLVYLKSIGVELIDETSSGEALYEWVERHTRAA